MCFVIQNILARWPAARPRCIPPACGFGLALSHPKPKTYRRFTTRKETSLSLHPSIKGRSCPCEILTISWRRLHRDRKKGAFALPFLGTIPSTKGRFIPLGTPTNPSRIGCRSGLSRPDTHDHFMETNRRRLDVAILPKMDTVACADCRPEAQKRT